MPRRRPHTVSPPYGAAADRSQPEQPLRTDSSPRRPTDKRGRDMTAWPHLPYTARQKEKTQPRQPGRAAAGGAPHDAANEIPYHIPHQQTVTARRIDQSQPRYLLCPTWRDRSRKGRVWSSSQITYHIEIKRFLMSKVYIIIIMRQKESIQATQDKSLLPTRFPGPFPSTPGDQNQPAVPSPILHTGRQKWTLASFKTEPLNTQPPPNRPHEAYGHLHSIFKTTF